MKTFSVVVLAMAIVGSSARCANLCSGHGSCGADDKCACYPNWQAADCSARTCPFDFSFGTTDGNHAYAECSDRGVCNRKDGLCECYDGFSGSACQRVNCPDDCNNHGSCKFLGDVVAGYDAWDAQKIRVCKCDPGYTGPDCATRTCEPGLDPMTALEKAAKSFAFSVNGLAAADEVYFTFKDWRGETWKTTALAKSAMTEDSIAQALVALPNYAVPAVTVDGDNGATGFTVTFDDAGSNTGNAPEFGVVVDACTTSGCQPYSKGSNGNAVSVTATAGKADNTNVNSLPCSNRGVCDGETGICECFEGFYGQTCESQTIIT